MPRTKLRTVRVRDLIEGPPTNLKLVCRRFPESHQYSADKRDYWAADPEHAFYCCGTSMMLAHQIVVFEEFTP